MGKRSDKLTPQVINDAMQTAQGNVRRAARIAGFPYSTFYDNLMKLKRPKVQLLESSPDSSLKIRKRKKRRYVITCAQNNTSLHENFIKSILRYCDHNDAQFIVIPIRYKNVTAWIEQGDYDIWWPPELKPYYLNHDIQLNDNLKVFGSFKIQATAINPLEGVGGYAEHFSGIFGHSQVQMKMVPAPLHTLPRRLLTTGSCSLKNYSVSKRGSMASFYHTFGATVVEIDGDRFWTRQITTGDDGCFYDLDSYYMPDSEPISGIRAAGLVCGDLHVEFMDPGAKAATFTNENSVMNVCQPENVYWHDVNDFYARGHWDYNDPFINYAKHKSGRGNVEAELERVVAFHNEVAKPDTHYWYIPSNHSPDHFTRWLKTADPKTDPENALFYHKMMVSMLESTEMTETGACWPNPLELFISPRVKNPRHTHFPSRVDKVTLNGFDLGNHGDVGANGAKGTPTSFARTGFWIVIGDKHTPCWEKRCIVVGTLGGRLVQFNQKGLSSWFHTNFLIYPDGRGTLFDIIKGDWRLEV